MGREEGGEPMWLRRLLMALALLLAVTGGAGYLQRLREMVPVVVTSQHVPAHTPLTAAMLTVRRVNREALESVAPRAVQRVEDAVGLITRLDLGAGEVIRREPWQVVVVPEGADPELARYRVPEGMRLASVRVDTQGGVAGYISQGDLVDVIHTIRSGGTGGVQTHTILQAVEVFAVAERPSERGSGAPAGLGGQAGPSGSQTITLLVSPQQAQILAQAKRSGGSVDLSIAPPGSQAIPLEPVEPPAAAGARPSIGSRPPLERTMPDLPELPSRADPPIRPEPLSRPEPPSSAEQPIHPDVRPTPQTHPELVRPQEGWPERPEHQIEPTMPERPPADAAPHPPSPESTRPEPADLAPATGEDISPQPLQRTIQPPDGGGRFGPQ